jgi:hypothetical protein
VGAGIAGCGDNGGSIALGGSDASPDSTIRQDSGGREASGGDDAGEAGRPIGHAHVFVVHASETAPPLRFCFGLATQPDGGTVYVPGDSTAEPGSLRSPELPFPGLFPGMGGALDDHGEDLSVLNLAFYAIDASKVATDIADSGTARNCAQLIGSDGLGSASGAGGALKLGADFWSLGVIPAESLLFATSWVYAITGCPAGASTAQVPLCGDGYDGTRGNLGFRSFQLDSRTRVDTGHMGAQFAQASYQWEVLKGRLDGGALSTVAAFSFGASALDGATGEDSGSDAPSTAPTADVAIGVRYGEVSPMTVTPIAGITFDGTTSFVVAAISLANPTVPVGGFAAQLSLPQIQVLTYGSAAAGVPFANGASFVFVLVGNPALQTAHVLAFPTFNP